MRRVASAAARAVRQAARVEGVSTSAVSAQAAPAAATAGSKPANMQEFKVYRWNPEVDGDKPRLQSYKARAYRRRRRPPVLRRLDSPTNALSRRARCGRIARRECYASCTSGRGSASVDSLQLTVTNLRRCVTHSTRVAHRWTPTRAGP